MADREEEQEDKPKEEGITYNIKPDDVVMDVIWQWQTPSKKEEKKQ